MTYVDAGGVSELRGRVCLLHESQPLYNVYVNLRWQEPERNLSQIGSALAFKCSEINLTNIPPTGKRHRTKKPSEAVLKR